MSRPAVANDSRAEGGSFCFWGTSPMAEHAYSNGRLRIEWGVLLQIIVYIVTLTLAYSALDKRISRLEDRYDRILLDLGEIKADVRRMADKP